MLERKIQTYTTNESGQKIVTYQGQGLGERKLVVQKNGRTVSGTYTVIDGILKDVNGVGNIDYRNPVGADIDRTGGKTVFTAQTVGTVVYYQISLMDKFFHFPNF